MHWISCSVTSLFSVQVLIYNRLLNETVNLFEIEKWKMNYLQLMHASTDPKFSKQLKERLDEEQKKNDALRETAFSLHRDVRSLAEESKQVVQHQMKEVHTVIYLSTLYQ